MFSNFHQSVYVVKIMVHVVVFIFNTKFSPSIQITLNRKFAAKSLKFISVQTHNNEMYSIHTNSGIRTFMQPLYL
jgi:hypothetical protein